MLGWQHFSINSVSSMVPPTDNTHPSHLEMGNTEARPKPLGTELVNEYQKPSPCVN